MNREEARQLLNVLLPAISLNFEKDHCLIPVMFMRAWVSPDGERLSEATLTITPLPWKNKAEQIYMMGRIKALAEQCAAEVVVLVTEAWYAEGLTQEQANQADAHVASTGSLKGFSGVQEKILIRLEWSTGAEFWEAKIEHLEGTVHLLPFEITEKDLPPAILRSRVDNRRFTN